MIAIKAQQHILSSVERGYFPQHGRGFQTVALSKELIGTRDLHTLERTSFYSLGRHHREKNLSPVKDTFFLLPSGRYALGRTVDFRVDSMGREGNFLAHHLIIESADLLALGADPFAVLDAMPTDPQSLDLKPRDLPVLEMNISPSPSGHDSLESIPKEFLASLAMAVVDSTEKTVLLVAEETQTKSVIRGLFGILAIEEKLHFRFSTHFFESHDLRPLFRIAAVHFREDAPSQSQDYTVFDLTNGGFATFKPTSAYSAWLSECVKTDLWEDIRSLNNLLNQLRGHSGDEKKYDPPANQHACLALWERAGTKTALALKGNPGLTAAYLKWIPSPRPLADAMLESASPAEICGSADSQVATDALSLLQASATGRVWREWVQRWRDDSALANLKREAQPWWKFW